MSTNSIKRYDNELPVKKASGAAFRSVTDAVKAAVREKEETKAYKLATEEALSLALHKLREAHGRAEAFRAFIMRWCIIFVVLLLLNMAVCVTGLLGWW